MYGSRMQPRWGADEAHRLGHEFQFLVRRLKRVKHTKNDSSISGSASISISASACTYRHTEWAPTSKPLHQRKVMMRCTTQVVFTAAAAVDMTQKNMHCSVMRRICTCAAQSCASPTGCCSDSSHKCSAASRSWLAPAASIHVHGICIGIGAVLHFANIM